MSRVQKEMRENGALNASRQAVNVAITDTGNGCHYHVSCTASKVSQPEQYANEYDDREHEFDLMEFRTVEPEEEARRCRLH